MAMGKVRSNSSSFSTRFSASGAVSSRISRTPWARLFRFALDDLDLAPDLSAAP